MLNHLFILCGPTGIGKTAISIDLAQHFKTCILSADSRQLYREMSIGTAVPSSEELEAVPHFFIQSHSIHKAYNVSEYESEVMNFLTVHFSNHQMALMVGGSGLYIDIVCNGIDDLPTIDRELRNKWLQLYNENGIGFLQQKVADIDPEYYARVDRNNPKRLLKAIEVFESTGKPYSSLLTSKVKSRPFLIHKMGLNMAREELYYRINQRVDLMIKAGLVEEVRKLYPHRQLLPLNTVGYKELFMHFEGLISFDEAVEQIKNHSRAYARRQLTWFRRDKSIAWFEPHETERIKIYMQEKLNDEQVTLG